MKTKHPLRRNDGVALIIVLGLLAVLTMLAVAFSVAMRVERLAARNYVNVVRAKALIQTALVRAMEDIDLKMTNSVYPTVPAWVSIATPTGNPKCDDMLSGEATNSLPLATYGSASNAVKLAGGCGWISQGITNGRVSYMIVDVGGLIDINAAGGGNRDVSTNINEIDIAGLPEIKSALTDSELEQIRDPIRRFETPAETRTLGQGLYKAGLTASNLMTFSYDVNHDQFFRDASAPPTYLSLATNTAGIKGFGTRTCALTNKFNINSITNFAGYRNGGGDYEIYKNDTAFMNNYKRPLSNILARAGIGGYGTGWQERNEDVCWNIVNYIDPDRIPQGAKALPYRHTEGAEPRPLINEIIYGKAPGYNANTSNFVYQVIVELWYPFAPLSVVLTDNFSLVIGIYDHREAGAPASTWQTIASGTDVLSPTYTYSNWTHQIDSMVYGTPTEFLVFTNTFAFYSGSNTVPITQVKPAYFYAQIRQKVQYNGNWITQPVDDAMGYGPGNDEGGNIGDKRAMFPLGATSIDRNTLAIGGFNEDGQGYSVCDPRSNGQVKYWTDQGDAGRNIIGDNYNTNDPVRVTLGTTNFLSTAYKVGRNQGLPIWAKNGPMLNIGELGLIFRSNLDDEYPDSLKDIWWWQTLNLMHRIEGATLLDLMSVRDERYQQVPYQGLFCINSRNTNAVKALFYNLKIGFTNMAGGKSYKLLPADIDNIALHITTGQLGPGKPYIPYMSFRTMFDEDGWAIGADYLAGGGGHLAKAFRNAAINAVRQPPPDGDGPSALVNDICKEDPFRHICELITFRQNLFTIMLAAQALGPDPDGPGGEEPAVLAEKRAVATIYRDSYTGRYFVRSFKWLTD